ncbi:MAG: site-specific DNA-methyltransferase [Chlorobium sp.]|nr:site-specific DNA-methyltransferase [Chlorobium sp.]
MTIHHQKLELTWIGKNKHPKLEPRILIEDPDNSYGDRNTENMLIAGDNLLALKALEQNFTEKIQCIYIDPPFNTGEAFEHYDDSLEHSIWLTLIRDRIQVLYKLLHPSGSFFIHIDDSELGYLIALLDEIFGRSNRISVISFKQSSASGPKAKNPGLVTTNNFIVYYAKDKSMWKNYKTYVPIGRDNRYSKYIENYKDNFENWKLINIKDAFCFFYKSSWDELRVKFAEKLEIKIEEFVLNHSEQVVRTARVAPKDVNELARVSLQQSIDTLGKVFRCQRENKDDYYFLNGEQLLFYRNKTMKVNGKLTTVAAATNMWDDLLSNNLHKEGDVSFPNGKKPEGLIKRILELSTENNDFILDSFAGSGTTGAVAHKMGRKWIMVELGEHCHTHIQPRLSKVCNGTDQSGISKAMNWQGGGGFKCYYMAPSLLKKDHYGQWVINKEYNPTMLAAAMAKHENFRYCPDDVYYWKQGQSSEKDFIFTTTIHVTPEHLDRIHEEMQPEESLLICCRAHFNGADDKYDNITVKKIPAMLLGKCEFDRDDYSLNIIDMPRTSDEPDFVPLGPPVIKAKKERAKPRAKPSAQMNLFTVTEE